MALQESEREPRGHRLDYWGVRPVCGCITAWMAWESTEEEVGAFGRRMGATDRDVIRGTKEQFMGRLDRCPHQGDAP